MWKVNEPVNKPACMVVLVVVWGGGVDWCDMMVS